MPQGNEPTCAVMHFPYARMEGLQRRPIPPIAWLLAGGTALALVAMAIPTLHVHGTNGFFNEANDAVFYRRVALSPFGTGRSFIEAGYANEIAYRYGRIGLPLVSWLVALGRPSFVPWTLIGVHLAAIAAVPGLSATLAAEYDAPPIAGAAVLLSSILFIRGVVYGEALLIACILLAYVLEARQHHRSALAAFAFAILVKETAVLGLVPWIWGALRRRDFRRAGEFAAATIPYVLWMLWVRVRIGEFPFLAHTLSRTQAIGWPGAGLRYAQIHRTPDHVAVVTIVLVTVVLCCVGAFVARDLPIGGFTATLAVLFVSLGPNALRYSAETLRLLSVPQVFALLCIAVAIGRRLQPQSGPTPSQADIPRSGARN
jgi:hypothetical protein